MQFYGHSLLLYWQKKKSEMGFQSVCLTCRVSVFLDPSADGGQILELGGRPMAELVVVVADEIGIVRGLPLRLAG